MTEKNTVKMSVLFTSVYRVSAISVKISASYFIDISKQILKFIGKGKRPRRANTILRVKNKVGGLKLSDFKTYAKSKVIKTVSCSEYKRQIDKWNDMESPEIYPHTYSQLIFDTETKAIQWNKVSLINGAVTMGHPKVGGKNPRLTLVTKINSK